MTPDFALSLSFDGLRLLMRGDAGWLLVGEVALDSKDMRAALSDLRHRGERLAGGPFEAKLLIPNEQIRYLALDGTMTTEEQVRAALDGATPYPVADLVYDYTKGGGRTYIAAVAHETLTEAEAFAREHGITPVSFAAVPEPFTFVGEVVFGPVSTAPDKVVDRDPDPVRVVGTAHLPETGAPGPDAVEDMAGLAPSAAAEDVPPAPVPEVSPEDSEPEPETPPATEHAAPSAPEDDADAALSPGAAAEDTAPLEPTSASSRQAGATVETPPATPPQADESSGASQDSGTAEETVSAPIPVFSSRRAVARAADAPGEREGGTTLAAPGPVRTDLRARQSMPSGPGPAVAPSAAPREEQPEANSELPASDAPAEAPTEAAMARPSIFSRAARTPQPRPGPAEPAAVRTPEPPAPDATRAPASGTAPPLRIEQAAPAQARPALLDVTGSGDAAPAPRPSWRETLAQRMRGKAPESASKDSAAKPAGKRPPLAFSSAAAPLTADRTAPVVPGPRAEVEIAPANPPAAPVLPGKGGSGSAKGARAVPPSGPALQAARSSSAAAVPVPPPDIAERLAQTPPPPADPAPGKRAGARILRRASAPKDEAAQPASAAEGERARMTVFGARREEESRAVGGKPRFLGLLLTVILLVAMAVVAAMAGAPEALSRLFAPREATTEMAAAPPPSVTASEGRALSAGAPPIAVPAAPGAPVARPDDAAAEAPLPGREPEAETAPNVAGLTPEALPLQPGPDTPPAPDAPSTEVAAAPAISDRAPDALPTQPEPQDSAAPSIAPDASAPRAAAPVGRVLTPSEAQRIYAATGVWQRAPRIPVTPRPEDGTGVRAPSSDRPDRPLVPGRPMAIAQALTDVRIPTPSDPPPPGTGFERDARGFILATPEGTLTPDGILVYAGAPPVLPDLRPGTTPPPADPTELAPDGAVADVSGDTLVIAAEPELAPPPRPEDLAPEADIAATDAPAEPAPGRTAAAPAPDVAFVNRAAIVPPLRPATITGDAVQADGAEPEAAGTATAGTAEPALAETTDAPSVRFLSSRTIDPPTRPASLASAARTEPEPAITTETEAEAAVPAGVAFIETRAIRPPARPADLAPAAAPVEEADPAAVPSVPTDAEAPGPRGNVAFVSTRAIVPPARPGSRAPTLAPDTASIPTMAAPTPAVLVRTAAVTPPVRSAAVVARATAQLEAERAAIAARAATVQVVETTPGGVSLTALDPPLRPERILAAARASMPAPATETATGTSLRPRARPGDLAPETGLAEADDADDDEDAEASARRNAELLAAAAAAADALGASVPGLASATPRAVTSSIRPDARPRNMATLVQRARQQQQREQARAAPAPAAAAPQATAGTQVQPSGRTSNTVATAATIDNAINLGRINLVGVYGRLDDRRALVRLPSGRYVRVAMGDRLDGGQVSSIGDGFITYTRGGRNVRLDLPG